MKLTHTGLLLVGFLAAAIPSTLYLRTIHHAENRIFQPGDVVGHRVFDWGRGIVLGVTNDTLTIRWETTRFDTTRVDMVTLNECEISHY